MQTGAYSAEYGRTSNGILNYTTKSGTNSFHGSLMTTIRNEKLNEILAGDLERELGARRFQPQSEAQSVRQQGERGVIELPDFVRRLTRAELQRSLDFCW